MPQCVACGRAVGWGRVLCRACVAYFATVAIDEALSVSYQPIVCVPGTALAEELRLNAKVGLTDARRRLPGCAPLPERYVVYGFEALSSLQAERLRPPWNRGEPLTFSALAQGLRLAGRGHEVAQATFRVATAIVPVLALSDGAYRLHVNVDIDDLVDGVLDTSNMNWGGTDLSTARVVIEVTERGAFTAEKWNRATRNTRNIREWCWDDIGSGADRFALINGDFHPHVLKLDEVYLHRAVRRIDVGTDAEGRPVTRRKRDADGQEALALFVRAWRKAVDFPGREKTLVLMEHVRALEDLQACVEAGLDLMQGFLFAPGGDAGRRLLSPRAVQELVGVGGG